MLPTITEATKDFVFDSPLILKNSYEQTITHKYQQAKQTDCGANKIIVENKGMATSAEIIRSFNLMSFCPRFQQGRMGNLLPTSVAVQQNDMTAATLRQAVPSQDGGGLANAVYPVLSDTVSPQQRSRPILPHTTQFPTPLPCRARVKNFSPTAALRLSGKGRDESRAAEKPMAVMEMTQARGTQYDSPSRSFSSMP